jgi:hypothetical protein
MVLTGGLTGGYSSHMSPRPRFALLLPSLLLTLVVLPMPQLHAQEVTGANRTQMLTAAKSQYYNLRAAGLKSFTCNVDIDWNALFTSINGKPLAPDGEMMKFLTGSLLSAHADLDGKTQVTWSNPGTPPEAIAKNANQIRDGLRQTLEGFFQAWMPSMNGGLVPVSPSSVKATPAGFVISDGSASETDEITMDKKYVISRLYNKSSTLIADMTTGFTASPKGLVMTRLDGTYQQPPTAPGTHVLMSATFQPVDTFQLPGSLVFTVDNVATFKMQMVGCKVEKQP